MDPEDKQKQQTVWDIDPEPLISEAENDAEFNWSPIAIFDPGQLAIEEWEIEFMNVECGWPCTPVGCCGHDTEVPETLTIGGVTLKFDTENFSTNEEYHAAIEVGRFLTKLIDEHKTKSQEAK